MASVPRPPQRSTKTGIAFDVLVPGAFYQCNLPGHFTDSLTGIVIPGPKAVVDDSQRRNVLSLTELPEPVQLPHFKLTVEVSDSGKTRKEIESDFNATDEQPVHEAFQYALATGIIRLVPDEEVEEKYPETWANRDPRIVWQSENTKPAKDPLEMIREAQDANRFARHAEEVTTTVRDQFANVDAPRKPPKLSAR